MIYTADLFLFAISDEVGDRKRPLPQIGELKDATEVYERKTEPSWDWKVSMLSGSILIRLKCLLGWMGVSSVLVWILLSLLDFSFECRGKSLSSLLCVVP